MGSPILPTAVQHDLQSSSAINTAIVETPDESVRHAHFDISLSIGSPLNGGDSVGGDEDHSSQRTAISPSSQPAVLPKLDIEHAVVEDDPRKWSNAKKTMILCMVSFGAITPTLGAAIYNPAFDELRADLHASDTELALSLSIFILLQGGVPIFWSSIAESVGRKPIYILSYSLFILGTVVAGRANSMGLLIGMRCIQAIGSSAVLSIGAGTLADIYEIKERGSKMGLYYAAPLLGPSLGPLIGGALTQAFNWRATFYFIAAIGGVAWVSFWFFPDTWRKERSLVYQTSLRNFLQSKLEHERKAELKRAKGLSSIATTPAPTRPASPTSEHNDTPTTESAQVTIDEKTKHVMLTRRNWRGQKVKDEGEFRLRLRDINPVPPALQIIKRPNNLLAVVASGFLFAAQYTVAFTAAVTFAELPYDYNALKIGLVLVSFGGGNIIGSILGGRYSDWILKRLKQKNNGVSEPEFRCHAMILPAPFMILGFLGYAWTAQEKTSVAGPVVCLFVSGTSLMVIYASALAYLVDSNPGRSSSAIAMNSFARGLFAFIMSEIALPIRNGIGDGGLYTLFAGLLAVSSGVFILLIHKGKGWRDPEYKMFKQRIKNNGDVEAGKEAREEKIKPL